MNSDVAVRETAPGSARSAPQFDRPLLAVPRLGRKRLGLLGLVLLVGLGAAWYGHDWWTVGRFIESTDDAYVGGDITVIAPKVAGFIAAVAVADNQAVHAGDLLVKLDDRDYRAALDKAEGAVAAQQAATASSPPTGSPRRSVSSRPTPITRKGPRPRTGRAPRWKRRGASSTSSIPRNSKFRRR